jgi:hypothetical protein
MCVYADDVRQFAMPPNLEEKKDEKVEGDARYGVRFKEQQMDNMGGIQKESGYLLHPLSLPIDSPSPCRFPELLKHLP